jgi:multiple sugar transport system permease protein
MSLFETKKLGEMAAATKVVVYGLLGSWTLIVLFPLYWVAVTSVKLPIHVSNGPVYFPFVDYEPSLHAWKYIFVDIARDTFRPYLNSLIVAICSTLLAMTAGSLAAYALSRFSFRPRLLTIILFILGVVAVIVTVAALGVDWRLAAVAAIAVVVIAARALGKAPSPSLGNSDMLFWMISQRIMPPVVAALPIYVMFQQLGLLDTHVALILTYTTVNLPIVVWLMYDFFVSIPRDLEESAELDGASKFRIFGEIILPLAAPGLVATSLLVLILAWNEYLLALFLSTAKAQTIPLLVAAQNATRGPQWWYMSVLIIIMIVPVVLLTLILQRFIAKGLLLGAVKG